MTEKDGLPILVFADPGELNAWLDENGGASRGIWLKLAKEGSGVASVSKAEAIDQGLIHGWIDGQLQKFDDRFYLVRFTPRSATSKWSRINRDRAEALLAQGAVRPGGRATIEAAKADGRWDVAYEPASSATVPTDLQAALDACPPAAKFFATLTGTSRYRVLYRIGSVKRAETRARKIAGYVEMLGRGEAP